MKPLNPLLSKRPLLYPHILDFMRFSDSTHHDIPKPIKYANSDSSPFNSDESLSGEISSQNEPTSPQFSKPLLPPLTSSTNLLSKDNSSNMTNENSSLKQLSKTHQNDIPIRAIHLHAIRLKTNLFYLIRQLTETLKLIITSDTNQKRIIVFS